MDSFGGLAVGSLAQRAADYRKRRFPDGKRNVCAIEGFVVFGYSDGATTIYRFLEDKAPASLGLGDGTVVGISYFGLIDMVRKDFDLNGDELKKLKPFDNRYLPLTNEYAFHRDVWYQDSDTDGGKGWKGYKGVGGSSSIRLWPTNHLDVIKADVLRQSLVRKAVAAYIEHANKQADRYRVYMATLLRY